MPSLLMFVWTMADTFKKKKPVPDPSTHNIRNAFRPDGTSSGPISILPFNEYRRKRNQLRNVQIEKRYSRKLEQNHGWSDHTEVLWVFLRFVNVTGGIFWNVAGCMSLFSKPYCHRVTK
jgi:hypothetical protein